jgi:hypothetical protein
VLYTPCGRSVVAFEQAVGYASLLFHFPEILAALQPGGERPEVLAETEEVREAMARVQPWDLTRADGTHHVGVSLADVIDHLSPLATLPACQAYWSWIRTEYAPAIARHGHYDPARGHAAPVGQELDVLERREGARELLNELLPSLGDETLAASAEEIYTDC